MIWNLFRGKRNKPPTDASKRELAQALADILEVQVGFAQEDSITSSSGGPKPLALGYVYGFIDAALRARGLSMADGEIGIPITFQVLRKLWPHKEREYTNFLATHLSDPVVVSGMMSGGQEYVDWHNNNEHLPWSLARYLHTPD